jgi:hypothetical protein
VFNALMEAMNREEAGSSWRSEYLKKQLEAARQKEAEEATSEKADRAFDEQAEMDEAAEYLAEEAAGLKSDAEQAESVQAEYNAQKLSHKENADLIYEGTSNFIGDYYDTSNWFLDVGEGIFSTGAGDDVIYQHGSGEVHSNQGNDIVYATQNNDSLLGASSPQIIFLDALWNMTAMTGPYGDDRVYGGEGTQKAYGMQGNDYFDLGNNHDIAIGGNGADEFIVDLQNTGRDTILDFVDAGDKITVLNGGALAEAGDWYLTTSDVYSGINIQPDEYSDSLFAQGQQFYQLCNSSGDIAAIFPIAAESGNGTSNPLLAAGPKHYQLTASMNSHSIEILSSCQCAHQNQASLQFI